MKKLLENYKRFTPFTNQEAWLLFKLAAWGEAVGWTLLISGIICGKVINNNIPVLIAGQIHGILFLAYITAAVILSPSLRWRYHRTLIAGLCAVPPYGSWMFELWVAHDRRKNQFHIFSSSIFYRLLVA